MKIAHKKAIDYYNFVGLASIGNSLPSKDESFDSKQNGVNGKTNKLLSDWAARLTDYYAPVKLTEEALCLLDSLIPDNERPNIDNSYRALLAEALDICRRYGGPADRYDPRSLSELTSQIRGEYQRSGKNLTPEIYSHIDKVIGLLNIECGKPAIRDDLVVEPIDLANAAMPKDPEEQRFLNLRDLMIMARDLSRENFMSRIIAEKIIPESACTPRELYELARIVIAGENIPYGTTDFRSRLRFLFSEKAVNLMFTFVRQSDSSYLMNMEGVQKQFADPDLI